MQQPKRKNSIHFALVRAPRFAAVSFFAACTLTLAACTATNDPVVVAPDTTTDGAVVQEPVAGATPVAEADVTQDGPLTQQVGEFGISNVGDGQMLASNLLDQAVYGSTGEEIGTVNDLLMDVQTGNILFAQIEHGGFLDIGDSEVMVPLSAMQWDATNLAPMLNMTEEGLENYPEMGDDWPNVTDPTWDDSLTNFWNNQGTNIFWDTNTEMNTVVWASNMIDQAWNFDVGSTNVEDLVIDLSQGRVIYALVSADGGLFNDDFWRAIPFSAFNASMLDTGELAIAPEVGLDQLGTAPTVDPNAFGNATVFGEDWDSELETYWNDAGYPLTAGADQVSPVDTVGTGTGAGTNLGVAGAQDVMFFGSNLDDVEVTGALGEDLGDIENIFIDVSTGQVLFATIEHGGFLDIGDEDLPVPLTAMQWSPTNDGFVIPIAEETLETFPDIADDWDTNLDPGWNTVSGFWGNAGVDIGNIGQVDINNVTRLDNLIGYGWGGYGDAGLGNVEDVVIDMGTGRIPYVVVSFVDAGLYGSEWRLLPYSAFDTSVFGDQLVLRQDFDMNLLTDSPRIDSAGIGGVNTLDPAWDDDTARYWDDAGYGFDD